MTRLLVLALLSLGLVAVPPAAPATAGEVVKMRLHRAAPEEAAWLRDTVDRVSADFGARVDLTADGHLALR